MLSEKPQNSVPETQNNHAPSSSRTAGTRVAFLLAILCSCVLILVCWFGGHSIWAGPACVEVSGSGAAEQNTAEVSQSPLTKSDAAKTVCDLIFRGKFDTAGEFVKQSGQAEQPNLGRLASIVKEYDSIRERRESSRKAAFKEQLAQLEKLKVAAPTSDANDPNSKTRTTDPNRAEDANEPSGISKVLSVIASSAEFADSSQRAELLSDPFVKQALQDAVDNASRLESQGKWLDAYANSYYWLRAIDPNNKGYLHYSEELLDKASIAASFQDSPCETQKERYEGVKKEMLSRAIDALNLQYVNSVDYAQMARKAVNQSKLLAEVVATAFSQSPKPEGFGGSLTPPEPQKLTAWSAAMAALSDQVGQSVEGFGRDEFLGILEKVLLLNTATVELPEPVMIAQFTEAALATLDPYTVMVWPKQVPDFEKLMTNEFSGIGIEILKPKGLLTVTSLLPDTPAYKSGLDAGDIIEQVDGIPTKDMSLMCAVKKITGPKGTKVTLTIKRLGEEKVRTLTMTRAKVVVPTIRGLKRDEAGKWLYMIDQANKIGYVRLTSFSAETSSELETVLKELESDGLKGLLLDLRFNSGGLLDSAVKVTDKFIREGLIVRTQPRLGMIPTFEMAHKADAHPDYPLVILINSVSASASEIVAGALADEKHKRAILVGERTHGKGLVQGITRYPGGGAELKYTMAYYHLPSGQRVKSREEVEKQGGKDWGIGPHVQVELRSDELKEMINVQRDNDVLVQADRDQSRPSPNKHTVEETLRADPQFAVAVLLVKTKLVETALASDMK